jgi:hypothetical protein
MTDLAWFVFNAGGAVAWTILAVWAARLLWPTVGALAFVICYAAGVQAFTALGYALEFFA